MKEQDFPSTIILCGFMSCGKSTLGRLLAAETGYAFVDTDQLLFESTGMSLQQMFAKGGEAYFRDLEHETVLKAAQLRNTVISTGGGVMTFERNASVLRENGFVIHIHRPFDSCYNSILRRKNRPIAGQKSRQELLDMYERRIPAYNKYADFILENTADPQSALRSIMSRLHQV